MNPPIDNQDPFADWTDFQLVAGSSQGGTSAQTEMNRRFMEATRESAVRLTTLTKWLIGLTVVIAVLTVVVGALTIALLVSEEAVRTGTRTR